MASGYRKTERSQADVLLSSQDTQKALAEFFHKNCGCPCSRKDEENLTALVFLLTV